MQSPTAIVLIVIVAATVSIQLSNARASPYAQPSRRYFDSDGEDNRLINFLLRKLGEDQEESEDSSEEVLRRGGGSKRGIAWPMENRQDSPNVFSGGKISWVYNWSPYRTNIAGAEFVPMLWSTNKGHDGNQFLSQARGAKAVLGFNEPERGEQANMNPAQAAQAWKQYIEPLRAQGTRLCSPAIASTQEGLRWMDQFLNELNRVGGRIDCLALHWYGRGADNFINWITMVRQRYGNRYPVWVTEFACTSWNPNQQVSQQEVTEFMRQSLAKLDSLGWVERYAWFGAQRQLDAALGSANCLIAPNGQLSDLGRRYVQGF